MEGNTNQWQINIQLVPRLFCWKKKWKHEHFLPTMSINYNNMYKTLGKHIQYACDDVFPLQNIQTIRQETGHLPGKVGVFGGTPLWPGLLFTFFIWTQQQNGLLIQASKSKRKRAKSPSRTTIGRVITSTKIHVVVRTGTKTKQNFNYNIIPWCLRIHCIQSEYCSLKSTWIYEELVKSVCQTVYMCVIFNYLIYKRIHRIYPSNCDCDNNKRKKSTWTNNFIHKYKETESQSPGFNSSTKKCELQLTVNSSCSLLSTSAE